MNGLAVEGPARDRQLRALGVERLQLRHVGSVQDAPMVEPAQAAAVVASPEPVQPVAAPTRTRIRRLALLADMAERHDPEVNKMYMALTGAVAKAGLQSVRVCDVAEDTSAAVMVFGHAPLPEGVPAVRVLRADPLVVLHADRERKRRLWEQLLALGQDRDG